MFLSADRQPAPRRWVKRARFCALLPVFLMSDAGHASSSVDRLFCQGVSALSAPSTTNSPHDVKAVDVSTVIRKKLPGFRVARPDDYLKPVRDLLRELQDKGLDMDQTVWEADFDGDGRQDWAVLVINHRKRDYRLYYILDRRQGYKFDLLLRRPWRNETANPHPITTPVFFKAAGYPGISSRTYNSLTQDGDLPDPVSEAERTKRIEARNRTVKPYTSVPAVEVWTGTVGNEKDIERELSRFKDLPGL